MQAQGDDMRRGRIYPWTRMPRSLDKDTPFGRAFQRREERDRVKAYPAGPQTRRSLGTQSRDRRADQDKGEQEGRVPRLEGPQGNNLISLGE